MSASAAQIRANQANEQKSTDPTSTLGKERSRQNALKHGRYTAKAIAERRWLRELLQDCQELLERF